MAKNAQRLFHSPYVRPSVTAEIAAVLPPHMRAVLGAVRAFLRYRGAARRQAREGPAVQGSAAKQWFSCRQLRAAGRRDVARRERRAARRQQRRHARVRSDVQHDAAARAVRSAQTGFAMRRAARASEFAATPIATSTLLLTARSRLSDLFQWQQRRARLSASHAYRAQNAGAEARAGSAVEGEVNSAGMR